jgi:hypothetical protein
LIKEEIIEYAIADASLEVLNGNYSRSELSVMLNKQQLLTTAIKFLSLTYIGLLFDFCWRSLRFALTTQKAVSHGPRTTYASKYGYATQAIKNQSGLL